ncbi:MAG: lipoyl(octanoyl) transferase LipB [Proteobacteria bacterium]|nr:lipoyl(octanoyl) transferase LipB [Pseudomonadota bacterium]
MNLDLEWLFFNQPLPYQETINKMEEQVNLIINKQAKSQIWVLEHPHLYTAGISSKPTDLLNNSAEIPIYETNRGGKYTYHGPGIKIVYVLLDLKHFFSPKNPDIASFVHFLQQWIIDTLQQFNIFAETRPDRVGLWVQNSHQEQKISAIGIKLRKWVSYHGIAINIDPDLKYFHNIVPCGLSWQQYGVTSIKQLQPNCNLENFNQLLQNSFYHTFHKRNP